MNGGALGGVEDGLLLGDGPQLPFKVLNGAFTGAKHDVLTDDGFGLAVRGMLDRVLASHGVKAAEHHDGREN